MFKALIGGGGRDRDRERSSAWRKSAATEDDVRSSSSSGRRRSHKSSSSSSVSGSSSRKSAHRDDRDRSVAGESTASTYVTAEPEPEPLIIERKPKYVEDDERSRRSKRSASDAASSRPPIVVEPSRPATGYAAEYYNPSQGQSAATRTDQRAPVASSEVSSSGQSTIKMTGAAAEYYSGADFSLPATSGPAAGAETYGIGPQYPNQSSTNYPPPPPGVPNVSTYPAASPTPAQHGLGVTLGASAAGYMLNHHETPASTQPYGAGHPTGHGAGVPNNPAGSPSHSGQLAHQERPQGPLSKFIEFWRDREGVAQFEDYTQAIGICKYCFEPGTTSRDAPRKHHYKPPSRSPVLSRHGNSSRVDKSSRYSSDDESRRKKSRSSSWLAGGIAGGLAAYLAKSIFDTDEFNDSYSVRSGTSSSRLSYQGASVASSKKTGSTHSRETEARSSKGKDRDDSIRSHKSYRRRRSRSRSSSSSRSRRSRRSTLKEAAIGAAIGTAVTAAVAKSSRSRSSSSSSFDGRRRRSDASERLYVEGPRGRRRSSPKGFKAFFTAPSANRHKRSSKKRRSFFSFANSSSSSADLDLAYGMSDWSASSVSSRSTKSRRKRSSEASIDAELLGLTAAAQRLAKVPLNRRPLSPRQLTRPSKHRTREVNEDDEWLDIESGETSSSESAVSVNLAYGSSAFFGGSRSSSSSLSSVDSGFSFWPWGKKKSKKKKGKKAKRSTQSGDHHLAHSGHDSYDNRSVSGSQASLQHVYPVQTSDPSRFEAASASVSSSLEGPPPLVRPGAIPLQQPQPVTPVSQSVYHPTSAAPSIIPDSSVHRVEDRSTRPRRRNSSPVPATEPIEIIPSSSKRRSTTKDTASVQFDLTKEQRDKQDRLERYEEERRDVRRQNADFPWEALKEVVPRSDRKEKKSKEADSNESGRNTEGWDRRWREEKKSASAAAPVAAAAVVAGGTTISDILAERESEDGRRSRHDELREKRRQERRGLTEIDKYLVEIRPRDETSKGVAEAKDHETEGRQSPKIPGSRIIRSGRSTPVHYDSYEEFFRPEGIGDHQLPYHSERASPAIIEIVPAAERSSVAKEQSTTSRELPWPVPTLRVIGPTPPTSHEGSERDVHSPVPYSPVSSPEPAKTEAEREETRDEPSTAIHISTAEAERRDEGRAREHEDAIPTTGMVEYIDAKEVLPTDSADKDVRKESSKSSESPRVPGAYIEDPEFAATLAAGAAMAGFDPSVVTDDAKYYHRDSPLRSEFPNRTIETVKEASDVASEHGDSGRVENTADLPEKVEDVETERSTTREFIVERVDHDSRSLPGVDELAKVKPSRDPPADDLAETPERESVASAPAETGRKKRNSRKSRSRSIDLDEPVDAEESEKQDFGPTRDDEAKEDKPRDGSGVFDDVVDDAVRSLKGSSRISDDGYEIGSEHRSRRRRREEKRRRGYEDIVKSAQTSKDRGVAETEASEDSGSQSFLDERPEIPSTAIRSSSLESSLEKGDDRTSGVSGLGIAGFAAGAASVKGLETSTHERGEEEKPRSSRPSSLDQGRQQDSSAVRSRRSSVLRGTTDSPTAIPIHFRKPPPSPNASRRVSVSSFGGQSPVSPTPSHPRKGSIEFKSAREIRPLWLVERHSPGRHEIEPEGPLPPLPSSASTSRTSSVEDLRQIEGATAEHMPWEDTMGPTAGPSWSASHQAWSSRRPSGLSISPTERTGGDDDGDYLNSRQATPTAATFSTFFSRPPSSRKEELKYEFHSPSELLQDPSFVDGEELPQPPESLKALPSASGSVVSEKGVETPTVGAPAETAGDNTPKAAEKALPAVEESITREVGEVVEDTAGAARGTTEEADEKAAEIAVSVEETKQAQEAETAIVTVPSVERDTGTEKTAPGEISMPAGVTSEEVEERKLEEPTPAAKEPAEEKPAESSMRVGGLPINDGVGAAVLGSESNGETSDELAAEKEKVEEIGPAAKEPVVEEPAESSVRSGGFADVADAVVLASESKSETILEVVAEKAEGAKVEEVPPVAKEPAAEKPVESSLRPGEIVNAPIFASELKSETSGEVTAEKVEEEKKIEEVALAAKEPAAEKPVQSSARFGEFAGVADAAVLASESKSETPAEVAAEMVGEEKVDEPTLPAKEPVAERPVESVRFGGFADVVDAAVLASVSKSETPVEVAAEKPAGETQAASGEADVDSSTAVSEAKSAPGDHIHDKEEHALEEQTTEKRSTSPRRLKDFGEVVDATVIAAVTTSATANTPSDEKPAEPIADKPAETPAEEVPTDTPAPSLSKKEKRKLARKKKKKSRDLDAEPAEEKAAVDEEKPVPEPSLTDSVEAGQQDAEQPTEEKPAAPTGVHIGDDKAESREESASGEAVSAERDITAERTEATERETQVPTPVEEVSQPFVEASEESQLEIERPGDSLTSGATPESAEPSLEPLTENHDDGKPSTPASDSPTTPTEPDVRDASEPPKETIEGAGSGPATPSEKQGKKKKKKKSKRVSFPEELAQETIIPPIEEERAPAEDEAKKTEESESPIPCDHGMKEETATSQPEDIRKENDAGSQIQLEQTVAEKDASAADTQSMPQEVEKEPDRTDQQERQLQSQSDDVSEVTQPDNETEVTTEKEAAEVVQSSPVVEPSSEEQQAQGDQDRVAEGVEQPQPADAPEVHVEGDTGEAPTEKELTEVADQSPKAEPASSEDRQVQGGQGHIAEIVFDQAQEREVSDIQLEQQVEVAPMEKDTPEDTQQHSVVESSCEAQQPGREAAAVDLETTEGSAQAQDDTPREVPVAQQEEDTPVKTIEEGLQQPLPEDISPASPAEEVVESIKGDLSEQSQQEQGAGVSAGVQPEQQSETAPKEDVAEIEQQPHSAGDVQAETPVVSADEASGKQEPPASEAPLSESGPAKEPEQGVEISPEVEEEKEIEKPAKQDLVEGQQQLSTEDAHAESTVVSTEDVSALKEPPVPEAPPVASEFAKEPEQGSEVSREVAPGQEVETAAKQEMTEGQQPPSTEEVHVEPLAVSTDDAQATQPISEPSEEPERSSKSRKKKKKDKRRKSSSASLPELANESTPQEPKDVAGDEAAPLDASSAAVNDGTRGAVDEPPAPEQAEASAAQPAEAETAKDGTEDQPMTEPGTSDAPQESVQGAVKEEASVAAKETEPEAPFELQEVRETTQDTPDTKVSQSDVVMADVPDESREEDVGDAPLETSVPETAEGPVSEPAQTEGDKVEVEEEPTTTEENKAEDGASVHEPQPMEEVSQESPHSGLVREQTDVATGPAEQVAVLPAVEDTTQEAESEKLSGEDAPPVEAEEKEATTGNSAEQPVASEEQTLEKAGSTNIDLEVPDDRKPESDAQPVTTVVEEKENNQAPQAVEPTPSVPEPPAETADGEANEFEPVSSKAKKKKDKKKRKASESLPKIEEAQPAEDNVPAASPESNEPTQAPVATEGEQITSAEPPASQHAETSEPQPVDIPGDNEQAKTVEAGDEFTTVKKSKKERRKEKKKQRKSLSEDSQSSPVVPDVGESAAVEPTPTGPQSESQPAVEETKGTPDQEMAVKPAEEAGGPPPPVDQDARATDERAEEVKEVTDPVSTEELRTEQARETNVEETQVREPSAVPAQEMTAEGPEDKDESLRKADDAGDTSIEVEKPADGSAAVPVADESQQPTVPADAGSCVLQEREESRAVETAAEDSAAAPSTEAPADEEEVKPSDPTEPEEKPLSAKARRKLEKKKKKQRRQTLDLTDQDKEATPASKDEGIPKQDDVDTVEQRNVLEPTADQATPQDSRQPAVAGEPAAAPQEEERESAPQETPVQDEGKETTQSSATVETDTKGKDFDLTDALVSTQVQRQTEDSRYPAPSQTSPEPDNVSETGPVGDEQDKREPMEKTAASDKPSVLAVKDAQEEEVEQGRDQGHHEDEDTAGKGDMTENKEKDRQPAGASQSATLATEQQRTTQEDTGEIKASRGLDTTLRSVTAVGQDEPSDEQAEKSIVGEPSTEPMPDQGHAAEPSLEALKEETPAPATSGKKRKVKKKKKKRDSLATVSETVQEEPAPAGDKVDSGSHVEQETFTTTPNVIESQTVPAPAEPAVESLDTAAGPAQPVDASAVPEDKSGDLQEDSGDDAVDGKKRKKKEKREARKRRKSLSIVTLDFSETPGADAPVQKEHSQTPSDKEKLSEGVDDKEAPIDPMELGGNADEDAQRSESIDAAAPSVEEEMKVSGSVLKMETVPEPATSSADRQSSAVLQEAVNDKLISAPSPEEDETPKPADSGNETEQGREEQLEVAPSPVTVESWSSIDIDKGRMLMEMRQDSSSDHVGSSDVGTLAENGQESIVGAYEDGASDDVTMQPETTTGDDRQKEHVAGPSAETTSQEEDTNDAVKIALAVAGFVGSDALIESAKKQAASDVAVASGTAKDVDIDPLLRSKRSAEMGEQLEYPKHRDRQDAEPASQSTPLEPPSEVASRRQSPETMHLERGQEEQAEPSTDKGDVQASEKRGLPAEDDQDDSKRVASTEQDTTHPSKMEQKQTPVSSSPSPVDVSLKDRPAFRFSPSPSRSPAGSQRGSPVYGHASAPLIEEHMSLKRARSPRPPLESSPSPQRMLDPIRESDEHDGRTETRRLSMDHEAYILPRPDSRRSSSAGSVRSLRRTSHNISGDLRAAAAADARRSSSPAESGKSDTRDDDWSGCSARDPTQPPKQTNQTEPTKQTPRVKQVVAVAHDPVELHDIPSSSDYDPVTDKGKRPLRGMTDVYEGWGETPSSPRSPTRPPSVRRRRSMQYIEDLEARLEQLISENRSLAAAKDEAEEKLTRVGVARRKSDQALNKTDAELRDKEAELTRLKSSLEWMESEVQRLTRENEELHAKQAELTASHAREVESLKSRQVELATGMEKIVREQIANAITQKDAELRQLRDELAAARQTVQELQAQIVAAMADDVLDIRDEDYFDDACQRLCQHVQQWVLRFSKHSDLRRCRSLAELRDPNVVDRFENAILDGTDADSILADRVRRRDVFVSVVMAMIWEYIFTRYLFGMDREQRQKLKALEKQLLEIGPRRAVAHWRALTLTLLTKRPSFQEQKARDTEAVALEIMGTLSQVLPPPQAVEKQLLDSLCNVLRRAADLSIAMRTQRAEYVMLAPLQPEYNTQGDLARHVIFNASLMNERSGATTSNEELEAQGAVVRLVLFPLVVKRGDDFGDGDDEIVVCPAQVLVARSDRERVPPGNRSVSSVVPSVEMG